MMVLAFGFAAWSATRLFVTMWCLQRHSARFAALVTLWEQAMIENNRTLCNACRDTACLSIDDVRRRTRYTIFGWFPVQDYVVIARVLAAGAGMRQT